MQLLQVDTCSYYMYVHCHSKLLWDSVHGLYMYLQVTHWWTKYFTACFYILPAAQFGNWHLFKSSQRDHGTLRHLLTRLGQLPNAKVPNKDIHACEDALQTIFKGLTVAAACLEIGIEGPDDDVQTADKKALLTQVSQSIVNKFTVITQQKRYVNTVLHNAQK